MKSKGTVAAVAVALTATTAAALSHLDSGDAAPAARARALDFVLVETSCGGAAFGGRRDRIGNFDICRGVLRDAGGATPAGHASWSCQYLGTPSVGSMCAVVLEMTRGDLLVV